MKRFYIDTYSLYCCQMKQKPLRFFEKSNRLKSNYKIILEIIEIIISYIIRF